MRGLLDETSREMLSTPWNIGNQIALPHGSLGHGVFGSPLRTCCGIPQWELEEETEGRTAKWEKIP